MIGHPVDAFNLDFDMKKGMCLLVFSGRFNTESVRCVLHQILACFVWDNTIILSCDLL